MRLEQAARGKSAAGWEELPAHMSSSMTYVPVLTAELAPYFFNAALRRLKTIRFAIFRDSVALIQTVRCLTAAPDPS